MCSREAPSFALNARRIGIFVLRIAVTAALLVWLARGAGGVGVVFKAARSARPEWVGAALAITLLVQLAIAYRLRLLIAAQGVALSTREVLDINLTTLFYGLFLPGGGVTAVALRYYRLTKVDHRYAATLVALVCDRVLATASLCFVGIAFWVLDDASRSLPAMALMLAASAALTVVMMPLFTRAPTELLSKFAERIPLVRRVWPQLSSALAAYRALPRAAQLRLFLISIAAHLLGLAVFFVLARSLELKVPLIALGWIRSAVILVTTLPISVSGLGVRDGALVALLGTHGVTSQAALAYSLLVFGVTVAAVGVLGGLIEVLRWLRTARAVATARQSGSAPEVRARVRGGEETSKLQ